MRISSVAAEEGVDLADAVELLFDLLHRLAEQVG
jgi:hypothetical protein